MKKLVFLFSILIFASFQSSEEEYRSVKNNDFKKGEKLTYLCHYGPINAGEATVFMDKELHTVNNRTCYKVDIDAKSIGMFRWTLTIKDKWQSYIDTAAIVPHKFYRNIHEGNYKLEETTYFDHFNKQVKVNKIKKGKEKNKTFEIPQYAQDLVSGYYYIRTLDFESLEENEIVTIDAFFENESYDFQIRYLGKDKVRTAFGKIEAFVFSPIMPENKMFFSGENTIKFWISDDANKVPLKIQAEMLVGAVEVELTNHKGLKTKLGKHE